MLHLPEYGPLCWYSDLLHLQLTHPSVANEVVYLPLLTLSSERLQAPGRDKSSRVWVMLVEHVP